LGILADSRFKTSTFQLEIDDLLVAYTDGITEVESRHGELWGQRRFETVVRSSARKTVGRIIHSILEEVSRFAGGRPQRDDMTLVVMRVQDGCGV
jgi:serine phosphatase RsbU (regulator of sigma subunit)